MNQSETDLQTAAQIVTQREIAFAKIDTNLQIETISQNFVDLLGDIGSDAVGQPITEVMLEFVGAEDALSSVMNGTANAYSLNNVYRENDEFEPSYLSFSAIAADNNNPAAGLLILAEDSTVQGQLEQQLVQERNELRLTRIALSEANNALRQLDAHKSMFLSMAAHDMRTPLAVIMGYASLLKHQTDDQEIIDEYADLIGAQTMWLSRLIGDLLDLDAIEKGKLAVNKEPFLFADVVATATEAVQPLYNSKQLTLHTEIEIDELIFTGDRDRIQQVLFNLLSNARKYTDSNGHVWLRVTKADKLLSVEIEDTGLGMTESDLSKLFSPYFRTERVKNSKITGTGLGLFIVKNLIEQHAGTIEVESEVDKGSKFIVTLPLDQA